MTIPYCLKLPSARSEQETQVDANILLDEGAQRSFITTKLADELGAKPISKENIAMSAFGSTEHSHRRLDVTMVDIITDNGDRIPLQVLVVPQIATHTP